jgi:endonuclease YncB( thermonuclease family)
MLRFAFAIVAACVLSTPVVAAEWPVCHGGNRVACHVTCVVDGDTWWRDGIKYRLACVDAVEIDDALGVEAGDELRQLLGQAATQVRDLRVKDPYHRSLAIIDVGGTTAGRILFQRGWQSEKTIAIRATGAIACSLELG